jgi:DNA-binding MarR family transcriptional regulator
MANTPQAELLKAVNAFAKFQMEHPGGDVDAFCRHRLAGERSRPMVLHDGLPIEAHMGRVFGHLSRMAHLYSKKVLRPLGVANLEDFGYLATLSNMDKPRKGELIRLMHAETTSGTSVIKRLLELGWVREVNDKEDGRSTRVLVTAKGQRTLERCFPRMAEMGRMFFGLLDPDEKATLFTLLRKIEEPHAQLLIAHRADSFEALVNKLYGGERQ